MVAKFVSCEFWNDKRAIVHNAIAMFLQKAWRIRNAYKHGLTDIDVADGVVSASMRRGADGIDARAGMNGIFVSPALCGQKVLCPDSSCRQLMTINPIVKLLKLQKTSDVLSICCLLINAAQL